MEGGGEIKNVATYLTEDEVDWILDWYKRRAPHFVGIMTTLVYTGARPVELTRLQWRDVTLDDDIRKCSLVLRSRKGKGGVWRVRNVPMLPEVKKVLEALGHRVGPVFLNSRGHAWAERNGAFLRYMKLCREELGLSESLRNYDLRHTLASWLRKQGHDLDLIGKVLGHTNHQTTMRYAHIHQEQLSDAMLGLRNGGASQTGTNGG